MMRHIIACSMLEQELTPLLPPDLTVTWLERGLHERPEKLRQTLQDTLNTLSPDVDLVLLAYGFCGGAMEGISCPTATLVLPLFDDCIGMLLQGERNPRWLYFTASWLEGDQFIGKAFDRAVEDYGQELAEEIYQTMLQGYQSVTLLDTHCFDVATANQALGNCTQKLGLSLERAEGDSHRLQALLEGGNTAEFWHLNPGEQFTLEEFLDRRRILNQG